ncbi:hypothetical protein ACFL6I_12165 [candidate division KSB1 bacterium]
MGKKTKKSYLAGIPAWALSLITLIVSFFLLFILASLLGSLKIISDNSGELIAYIIYDILIALACFTICRTHPKSVWYTPVICSLLCIISAFVEPTFWVSPLGILLGSGFVLSVMGAIIGASMGRRLINRA